VTLPEGFRDTEIALNAARDKLWLWPLSPSYMSEPPRQGFILGFGSTPAEQIPQAVHQLQRVLKLS